VEIEEKDKENIAFTCTMGLFKFNIMLFELSNAPATFQRMMNKIVERIDWQVGSNYLDDLMIGLLSFKDHINHLEQVFQQLSLFGLSAKLSKCHFFKQIEYFRHKISSKGVRPNLQKIEAITCMKPPTNLNEFH
jgi:hypothetical protein